MTVAEIKSMQWTGVDLQHFRETVSKTNYNKYRDKFYVSYEDVDNFVQIRFYEAARKLGVDSKDLLPVLQEENEPFYNALKELYVPYSGYSEDYKELLKVMSMLRVPDTRPGFRLPPTRSVDKVWESFKNLSDSEKLEFLHKIGVIRIEVNCE